MSADLFLERTWGRRKFFVVFLAVFLVQLGFLLFAGRRTANPTSAAFQPTSFRMLAGRIEPGTLDLMLVSDPTLFVLPGYDSFSGAAWMKLPAMEYSSAEWNDSPEWLKLSGKKLGDEFEQKVRESVKALSGVSVKMPPSEERPQAIAISQQSRISMEGSVAKRFAGSFPPIPTWQSVDPLDRSTVEVLVDDRGHIVSARLVQRSGFAAADDFAIKSAASLVFAPSQTPSLERGRIHFLWWSDSLPSTNSIPPTTREVK